MALTAAAVLTLAGACGSQSAPSEGAGEPVSGGTFTMAINTEVGSWDPYTSNSTSFYMFLAYDPLINVDAEGNLVDGLAEDWESDATTATFTLRADVTCSDGTPLTASQVAEDLTWVGNPENKAWFYGVFTPSTPYTVTADDAARTVTVTVSEPHSFLLRTIGTNVPIVCGKGMADRSILTAGSDGTGPLVLESTTDGKYTFSVRPDYRWGPNGATASEPGMPDKVVLQVVENETTAANLLLAGELNAAVISGADGERLEAAGLGSSQLEVVFGQLWFNQRPGRITADQGVREALLTALDLDELARISTSGRGVRATAMVGTKPSTCPGNTTQGMFPDQDPARAESLLDQAGWGRDADGTRSKDGTPLALEYHYLADNSAVGAAAEAVAEQWERIGVQTKLVPNNAAANVRTLFETGEFDVYWSKFIVALPSMIPAYVTGQAPPAGTNFADIHNPAYEDLAARATQLTDEASCPSWLQAERALFERYDLAPVVNSVLTLFTKNATAEFDSLHRPIATSIRLLSQ